MLLALRTVFACVAFLFMGMASTLQAATVTATWNPNPESNIAGYKLSYGTQSGVYTTVVDVGNVTSWPVTLAGPQRYYFAVQAYNTSSLLSPYSTEIIFDAPAPPALTSLSPALGPVGTAVTITGTSFGTTQGTSTVKFNGISATPTSWSATSIVVPVPVGALTGNVVVTVSGAASNALPFTVAVPPVLTSLTPANGPIGTSVTIAGANFGATKGTSTVTFNGTTATPTTWSATSIVVPVPAGATTGSVVVTVAGLASNAITFTVRPTLTSLTPASGLVGTSVTIAGTNFGATKGTSTVTFNGTSATPTSWSATSIVVPVPAGATTGNVVVTVSSLASNTLPFTVTLPTPTLTSLTPATGQVGTSVTIAGTNFGATKGTSTVTFNGTSGTPTSWSATSIVVPVPAGATTGNVVVTVGGQASNGLNFTVSHAPVVTNPGNQTIADNEGYAQRVMSDTPVSYWRLAENSGSTASDRMGVNNGVLGGNVVKGQPGVLTNGNQAFRFNGADGTNVMVPGSATLNAVNGSSAVALEAWINPQTLTLPTHFGMFYSFPGSSASYVALYDGGGTPQIIVSMLINGVQRVLVGGPAMTAGAWYHVVVSYDGAALTLYVNGSVANQLTGLSGSVMLGAAGVELGGYPMNGGYGFNGLVDEAAAYAHALSAAQVAAHYALRTSTGSTVSLQVNASDPDGDSITYGASGLPAGVSINTTSGLITGTLSPTSAGSYSVTVTASDGSLTGSQTFTWTVTHTNRPPTLPNPGNQTSVESTTVSLPLGATDPDGNTLTYSATGLPTGLSINTTTGLVSGTLGATSFGGYAVTVTVSDGTASTSQSFSWIVNHPNQAPTLTSPGNQSKAENDVVSLALVGSDPDGNPLTYGATGLPPGLGVNSTTGLIAGTLPYGSAGTYTVTATVSDGVATASRTFTWSVAHTNRAPALANPGNQTAVGSESYAQAVLRDVPVSYWTLAEAAGGSASDRMGINPGTVGSGVTLGQPGAFGDNLAMRFSGADGATVSVPGSSSLGAIDGTSAVTMEAWINPTLTMPTHYGIFYSFPGSPASYLAVHDGTGTPRVLVALMINGVQQSFVAGPALVAGSWYHIVATYDGSALVLYVNGVAVGQRAGLSGPISLGAMGLKLGGYGVPGGYGFSGRVDDAAIYGRALTSTQVAAHYGYDSYSQAVRADTPTAEWRLAETGGTVAADGVGMSTGALAGGVTLGAAGALASGNPAMQFDGADGTDVGVPANSSLNSINSVSAVALEAWINLQSLASPSNFRLFYSFPGQLASYLGVYSGGGTPKVIVALVINGVQRSFVAGPSLVAGSWYHVVASYDGAALTLYVNGAAVGQLSGLSGPVSIGTGGVWLGGYPVSGSSYSFNGSMDEAAIYPHALSAAQVAAHYTLRTASAGASVSLQLAASDADGDAITYGATGLPPGLSINTTTGLISGTLAPASAGTYTVTVTASDGSKSTSTTFTWTVPGP